MVSSASILREIHRLRRHAKNLQDEIERLPRLLRAQQVKAARQEACPGWQRQERLLDAAHRRN